MIIQWNNKIIMKIIKINMRMKHESETING